MNDILSDTLARMKNAILRGKPEATLIKSKMVTALVEVLKEEEFIGDYKEVEGEVVVNLLYADLEPVISHFERVSKPGQRIYVSKKEIFPVMNGRGISVISTSQGVMTGARAKYKGLGGEFLCKIW